MDDIDELKEHVGGVEFQQAAREGNVRVIRRYISSKHFKRRLDKFKEGKGASNPLDELDSQGTAALHYASRYNNIEVMEILIDNGAGECCAESVVEVSVVEVSVQILG